MSTTQHTDGLENSITGRKHCNLCGSFLGDAHECVKTKLHCGSCDAITVIQATKEALAGKTYDCDACGATNIIPSPGAGS